jgi:glutamate-ammonia-ligase adenylyltransferase
MRRHELLRMACAEVLGLVDVTMSCAALSSVWIAVLQAALDAAVASAAPPRARIVVIGMGRLGGAELGYASDADVLFVCEPLPGVDDHEGLRWVTSVAEAVRGGLGAPSQDPALRVDADLRPEGRSGPLVRTLTGYQAYYRRWAQVWDAQALLRATVVAGDVDLGARFLRSVDLIRYPADGLDEAKVREIRRIKARVDTERLPKGADATTHTKLGRGGLADVEWTIQLLQLRHAHRYPELRTTSTRDGLRAAHAVGLLSAPDLDALLAGWTVATRARNAIMLVRGKPGDQLPMGRDLVGVARTMGYPARTDPGEFVDDYRRTTRRARSVVEKVFYDD